MVDLAGFGPAHRQFMRLLLYPGLATGPLVAGEGIEPS